MLKEPPETATLGAVPLPSEPPESLQLCYVCVTTEHLRCAHPDWDKSTIHTGFKKKKKKKNVTISIIFYFFNFLKFLKILYILESMLMQESKEEQGERNKQTPC